MATLHRTERYLWPPALTLHDATGTPVDPQPDPGQWEASFDDGATWVAGRAHPDHPTWPCWLIQGPLAPDGENPDATITGYTLAQFRRIDTPEVVVATLPVLLL